MIRPKLLALTGDGRRMVSDGAAIWREVHEIGAGKAWRELPTPGLPEGARIHSLAIDAQNNVTLMLADGSLWESHREAHQREPHWRPVIGPELPR